MEDEQQKDSEDDGGILDTRETRCGERGCCVGRGEIGRGRRRRTFICVWA